MKFYIILPCSFQIGFLLMHLQKSGLGLSINSFYAFFIHVDSI